MKNQEINNCHSRMSLSGISTLETMKEAEVPDNNLRVRQHKITTQTPDKSFPGWNKAFTLIELLVVVLIIGILAVIALPQYTLAVEKARAAEALSALKSVSMASNAYYLANGSYTGMTKDNLDVTLPTLSYSTFSINIYEPNHMDLIFLSTKEDYQLVGVHYDGRQTRIYCQSLTEQAVKICKALGAPSSCVKNGQCNLSF